MDRADPLGWVGATLESKYRIDALVGEGGFGFVYRGTHLRLRRPVAVKFLRPDIAGDGERREKFMRRFETEGRMLYDLSRATAGVVQAHDLGIASSPRGESTPFIVMEWLDGYTLAEELRMRPTRSVEQALDLLAPVLDALVVAHEMGIAHRDLKPTNLMLCRVGSTTLMKVLDFGIAQVVGTDADQLPGIGTMHTKIFSTSYGAPEQFDPSIGPTGPWTDVYAFGLLLIEAVDGRRAYTSEESNASEALNLAVRPTVRSNRTLDTVMRRVMAVDPRNRPQSAKALKDLLARRSATTQQPNTVTQVAGAARPKRPGLWWPLFVIPAIALIPIGAIVYLLGQPRDAPNTLPIDPDPANQNSRDAEVLGQLDRWQKAEDGRNWIELEKLYADKVCFYQQTSWKPHQIVVAIQDFYDKRGTQKLVGAPHLDNWQADRVRVEFAKDYSVGGGPSKRTMGFLVFDANHRIVAEGDDDQDATVLAKGGHLCSTRERL